MPGNGEAPGVRRSRGLYYMNAADGSDAGASVPRATAPALSAVRPDGRRRLARLADLLRWAAV